MKTKILVSFVLLLAFTANQYAQTAIDVVKDSTYTYGVTPNPATAVYTYTWSHTSTGTTTDLSTFTGKTVTLTWNGAVGVTDSLKVFATETSGNFCVSDYKVSPFHIVSALSYSATIGAVTNTCPKTTANTTGGNDATVAVSLSGYTLAAGESFTVYYTVDGTPGNKTFAANVSSGTVALANGYTNNTGLDANHPFVITAVKVSTKNTQSIPAGSRPSKNFVVYAAPQIGNIF